MRATDKLDVGTQGQCMTALSGLTDALSSLERIRTSPIPMAYSIHLKHCLFIYLLAIPFQVGARLGTLRSPCLLCSLDMLEYSVSTQVMNGMYWFTIPTVGTAAFTLLGIESIGRHVVHIPISDGP